MSRLPSHDLVDASPQIRPMLEDVARVSLTASGRLLNLHAQMAHAPAVLAAYAGIRKATEDHGTFDFKTRTAIMLTVSCAQRSDYAIAVNTLLAQRAGWSPDAVDRLKAGRRAGEPRLDALLTVVRDASASGGHVSDTTWRAALDAGNDDVTLAEAFVYISLTQYVAHFLAYAETEYDVPTSASFANSNG